MAHTGVYGQCTVALSALYIYGQHRRWVYRYFEYDDPDDVDEYARETNLLGTYLMAIVGMPITTAATGLGPMAIVGMSITTAATGLGPMAIVDMSITTAAAGLGPHCRKYCGHEYTRHLPRQSGALNRRTVQFNEPGRGRTAKNFGARALPRVERPSEAHDVKHKASGRSGYGHVHNGHEGLRLVAAVFMAMSTTTAATSLGGHGIKASGRRGYGHANNGHANNGHANNGHDTKPNNGMPAASGAP